jgi:predicted MFS family arabinose efflux permease
LGHFNDWYGWRATIMIAGLPGILIALLVWLTIKEPPRGYSDGPTVKPRGAAPPFFDVFKFLLSRNSFVHMSLAAALHSVVWYAGSNFNNAFFQRSHELTSGQAGTYIAIFSLIGGVGSFAGGLLSDRLSTKKADKRWYMWVPGVACFVMVPFQFFAYLSPDLDLVVPITFSLMIVLASMFFGPSFAVAQSIATVRMRAVSASVLLFIQTIIGLTLGPAIVGLVSDYLQPTRGADSLAYAMAIIGVLNFWAALHYFLAARRYREDLAETAKLNAAAAA